jgi:hypothetical protein
MMDEVDKVFWYLFLLALALVFLAYYVGAGSDITSLGSVANKLGLTFTGRNAQGQFAAYPAQG